MKRIKTKNKKMYLVYCNEKMYLGSQYVFAKNQEEAEDKYAELWERGMCSANDSDLIEWNTKRVVSDELDERTLEYATKDAKKNEMIINNQPI